jgi:proline racemase
MRVPSVFTVDYHTAGAPFRIVADPPVDIDGSTVAERRIFAINDSHVDDLRKLLCFEPRGHADMYGGFITPPDDPGADFGVLFWHKDGFSTACGHGTIALGVWALQTGRVRADPSGITEVVVDVPSGRVTARVHGDGDVITHVDFVNVPSYLLHSQVPVRTSRGDVTVDIGFGSHVCASERGRHRAQRHAGALRRSHRHWARSEVGAQRDQFRSSPQRRSAQRHLRDDPFRRPGNSRRQPASAQRHRLR